MKKSQLDLLEIQDQEAVKNTYYRYPKVTPHLTKYEDRLEVKTIDDIATLRNLDGHLLGLFNNGLKYIKLMDILKSISG